MTTPDFRALLANDAYAASFQSLGQYRTALLKALDATPPPVRPTDEELLESAAKALGYKSIPSDETCLTAEAGELLAYARAVLERWGK